MKKRIILLLSLMLALTLGPRALAEGEWIEIRDPAGLAAIANDPEGHYRLACDLDMTGVDWTPIPLHGALDGAGHGIYNLTVTQCGQETLTTRDGNRKPYDTAFAGLFSEITGATVENLGLYGVYVAVESESHCFAGALAGYMQDSTVTHCTVQGRVHLISHGVNAGVGGLVGFGSGVITDCSVSTQPVFVDRYTEGKCEQFLGGLLSCGVADIEGCQVDIDGYASCHGYSHNGGLVGMYYPCGLEKEGQFVRENVTCGRITFFEDNSDRRAYCAMEIGEPLRPPKEWKPGEGGVDCVEVKAYDTELWPETCETPQLTEMVVPPNCSSWGYTTHICTVCNASYTDTYVPPEHHAGGWQVTEEATETAPGRRVKLCVGCGEVLEEETFLFTSEVTPTPAATLVPAQSAVAIEPSPVTGVSLVQPVSVPLAPGLPEAEIAIEPRPAAFSVWGWIRHYILFGWLTGD